MPLFTLSFNDDEPLFSMAFHPEKPQFLLGFATGHVRCYEYTPSSEDESLAVPTVLWSTKRHKGSCRAVAYDQSGQFAVSCGSEGVVKKFDSATGKVKTKLDTGATVSAMAINEEYIVIGDEKGKVRALKFDLSIHRTYNLEDIDSITAICPLDSVNKHNFALSGDMHVFRIDVRKDEVVSKSEDQEDEILCGCIASETRSAWGLSEGVLTVWNNKGLGDQQQRVKLTKDGSVDAVIAGEQDDHVTAGTSDGWVAEVDLISAQVLHRARHNPNDIEDEVGYLDYDYEYRLVSASMSFLRVWAQDELESAERAEKASAEAKAAKARKAGKSSQPQKKKKGASKNEPKAFADLLD